MSDQVIVLVTHARADASISKALEQLGHLATSGLLQRYWVVDLRSQSGGHLMAELVTATGNLEVPLLRSVAEGGAPRLTRIVTAASAELTGAELGRLHALADELGKELRRLQPHGVPLYAGRVVFPESLTECSELTSLLDPANHANVVVVPEDRADDTGFAVPLRVTDDEFAAHVAIELATQAGLWSGMEGVPIDRGRPGVIDDGDTRVHLARSFVRLAMSPPLPLHEAMSHQQNLPRPRGCEPAPVPSITAAQLAQELVDGATALRFSPPEPFESGRQKLGLGDSLRRIIAEAGRYVQGLPRQLVTGFQSDLEQVAGEALTAALGDEAGIEVVWRGKEDEPLSRAGVGGQPARAQDV
jgi:hypothetical protein